MEWIKCSERLPEPEERILFVSTNSATTHFGHLEDTTAHTRFVSGTNKYITWGIVEVTHWMPLPPPPDEG